MLDLIVNAVFTEIQDYLATLPDGGGQAMFMADFLNGKQATTIMPLVLLQMTPGEESGMYGGGLTKMYYTLAYHSYNYFPDAYGDELASGYSTSLLRVIDQIRRHLGIEQWLTPGMAEIKSAYDFTFTLGGIGEAMPLQKDGLMIGHAINMKCVSFDPATLQWRPGPPLQSLLPSGVPPVS